MKILMSCAVFLLFFAFYASEIPAMQNLAWNGREINGWICSGDELRPRTGANSHNTWILRGNEIRLKAGGSPSGTWVRQGDEIRPKVGANSHNTWILRGNALRPKVGANSSNTWNVGNAPLLVIVGKVILRLF